MLSRGYLFAVVLHTAYYLAVSQFFPTPQPYSAPDSCQSSQFFRTGDLTCAPCFRNQESAEDGKRSITLLCFLVDES